MTEEKLEKGKALLKERNMCAYMAKEINELLKQEGFKSISIDNFSCYVGLRIPTEITKGYLEKLLCYYKAMQQQLQEEFDAL